MIEIKGRLIGVGHPVYCVAEISANHNQDFDEAARLLKSAKQAKADAVKVQAYTPDTLTIKSSHDYFRIKGGTLWDGCTLYDLYEKAYTPWEWYPGLKMLADEMGLDFFASAFDPSAVDFLEEMRVPVHKVASFEIVDIPLITKMAGTGKPLIISTGMATLAEVEEAVQAARVAGAEQIALLKCTSAYPASPESMNLRTIPHLAEAFGVPVGLSDHTLGVEVPIAAVTLGACIIEKHFTLSRSVPGPDSAFSLEPHEFEAMVEGIRVAERALGKVQYGVSDSEAKSRIFRRSLFVVQDVKVGETFTSANIRSIRPGHGIHPRHLDEILGRRAGREIPSGTPLNWSHVDPNA